MNMNRITQVLPVEVLVQAQREYLMRIYAWMVSGLMVTGLTAFFTASSEMLTGLIYNNMGVFFFLFIGQIFLVGSLAGWVERMSVPVAAGIFLLYSFLNGLTLSAILLVYSGESIATAFFVTAGTFGIMSFYGYVTKRDLSGIGNFMFMGVIGIILASVVNWIWPSSALNFAICIIGVLIFTVLTAVDTQRLKESYEIGSEGTAAGKKSAIVGALRLYLDFINIFLFLIRLLGGRR